ncbi:unnamed protein product [Acanthoscelides obtectus]|uniref:Uncharacterized protein n=1 Tax=Acanthoscelides obtectus TaxID=200917 RepID=A0A9P0Q0W5_ACAOB|nr:unnamed protein product [Acanthoscelides obtectus]CAK1670089.1 hypothetical protein AOBTE_LOCUS27390 [Acanthoscelides obtectus]
MGVLWRKRSVLIKLAVVVGTAWLTIAFLFYTETSTEVPISPIVRTNNEIGMPQRLVMQERETQRVHLEPQNPFKEAEEPEKITPLRLPARKSQDFDAPAVLVPPQDLAGDMGKPVVLPANLTGKSLSLTILFLGK